MIRVIALNLLVAAVLFAPLALDAWDTNEMADRIADATRDHAVRVAPVRAAAFARAQSGDPYPKLVQALSLGKPLSASLWALTELAGRSGLAAPALTVQPPTQVERESGAPVLSEHRVRLVARGLPRAVHRFVQTLPELAAPVRIESARLTEPAAKEPAAVLEMDLRVLVEAN